MAVPTVTTLPNTADSDTSPTTLSATVNPNGLDTQVYFQWGPLLDYFYTTTPQDIGSGSSPVTVMAMVPTVAGTYHYSAVATNSSGTSYGLDQQFDIDTTFTQGVLNSITAWSNSDLTNYASALASMFETVYGLVVAQGDPDGYPADYEAGWSVLLNPMECPTEFLPYLSQFVGAQVQPGTPDAQARNIINTLPAMARGTPAALVAAAQTQLSAPQTVYLLERQNQLGASDPYHIVLTYYQTQLLASQQLLINAVEAVKPAGIQITYVGITGYTWNLAIHNWSADTMTWSATSFTQP